MKFRKLRIARSVGAVLTNTPMSNFALCDVAKATESESREGGNCKYVK